MGALVMAFFRKTLDREALSSSLSSTVETTAMVFFILIGASLFSLVFRGYGGDELVAGIFEHMPGGVAGALAIVMLTIFLLFYSRLHRDHFRSGTYRWSHSDGYGCRPHLAGHHDCGQPANVVFDATLVFLYLRGVVPDSVATRDIYLGVIFILIQLAMLAFVAACTPTWLPEQLYQ